MQPTLRSLTVQSSLALGAVFVFGFSGRVNAQQFVGGGDAPTYDTTSAVSIVATSGTRDPINQIINGAGMTSKITDIKGEGTPPELTPQATMCLFRNIPDNGQYVIPPSPTGLTASNWVEFDLGSVVDLSNLWVWNWNEGAYPSFGWKHLTVHYSANGTDWTQAFADTLVPMSDGSADSAVDLVAPFGGPEGVSARYVVMSNIGVGSELTYYGDDGVNDAGLSEVRFELVPEPASIGLLALAGLATLRRRP